MQRECARAVLLILSFLAIAVLMVSCSGDNAGTTAAGNWEITSVDWPTRYLSDASVGLCTVGITVYIPEREGMNCWARLYHRTNPTSTRTVVDDTSKWTPWTMTHQFNLSYDSSGAGIYTLEVGISRQGDDLFKGKTAVEWYPYDFFVDRSYYYHDVDVEYIYQEGCDLFAGGFDFNETVAKAYADTRVCFNYFERRDPAIPLPQQQIGYDPDLFLQYRDTFGLYWDPGDHEHPVMRYLLGGVTEFIDPGPDTVIDNIGGATKDYRIALVASGRIRDLYRSQSVSHVCCWAAAHELGHTIGLGLTDAPEHPSDHDTNGPCVMMYLCDDASSLPWYLSYCGSYGPFHFSGAGFMEFCSQCRQNLNDVSWVTVERMGERAPDQGKMNEGKEGSL